MTKLDVPTILTFIVILLWVVSFIVRVINPTWADGGGQSLDASVLLVLGYWFVTRRSKNGAKLP